MGVIWVINVRGYRCFIIIWIVIKIVSVKGYVVYFSSYVKCFKFLVVNGLCF